MHEQEVVIVGYTEPRRSRKYFGSLVLAVRDNATKRWVYAGHVGTGFDQAALKSLYGMMQPLRADKKPFDQKVKDESATTWLIPKLVGEVKFTEWTSEGEMRHPAFLGLRTDKKALRQISKTSIGEIDSLIVELRTLHKKLETDGDRIQRDIAEHAELSQQVIQLTKIISDSVRELPGSPSPGPRNEDGARG